MVSGTGGIGSAAVTAGAPFIVVSSSSFRGRFSRLSKRSSLCCRFGWGEEETRSGVSFVLRSQI